MRSLMNSPIVSFWNDQGEIHIMDLTKNFEQLKNNVGTKKKTFAQEIVLQSDAEGFGIAWNPHKIGQLVTGNTLGQVEVFENNESYTSWKKSTQYSYHQGSVEDIVFSPTEPTVFASCTLDIIFRLFRRNSADCGYESGEYEPISTFNKSSW